MPDLDALAAEIAPDLMIDRARSLDRLFVRNTIGGSADLENLTDDEYEDLIGRIISFAETADITIEP